MAPEPTTPRRPRGRPRTYDHALIAAALDLGLTRSEVARMYGCHYETVRYIANNRRRGT